MTVDLYMAYNILMLVSMTLTLMQGHSGSAKDKNQCWIISTTKQATSIALAMYNGRPLFYFFTWPWLCKRLYGLTLLFFFLFFFATVTHVKICSGREFFQFDQNKWQMAQTICVRNLACWRTPSRWWRRSTALLRTSSVQQHTSELPEFLSGRTTKTKKEKKHELPVRCVGKLYRIGQDFELIIYQIWNAFAWYFSVSLWFVQRNRPTLGWRVGSVVRALDWRSKSRGFESRQEH